MMLRADAVQITLCGPDGRAWQSNLTGAKNRSDRPGENLLEATILVDPAFVGAEQEHPVTLRASFYLTLFGHTRNQSIDLRRGSTTVLDRLRCGPGAFGYVDCRAAFRWPALLLYTTSPGRELSSFNEVISYSPFPAQLSLNPIESRWAFGPLSSGSMVTIVAKEPLAHLRRDLEAGGLRLADLTPVSH
jgi:hypothetical protein